MDSRYLLFLNTEENEYTYIDLFKNNLLTINKKVLSSDNKDKILALLNLTYNIQLNNKFIKILYLNELPNLEISIDEKKIKKHDSNIEEYNIEQISNNTEFNLRGYQETIKTYTPRINIEETKYLILKNNNIPYYIDLKSVDSLIRKILNKNVYSIINKNELTLINELINNINSTNITYDKSTLNETKYELKELLYFDCNTYEENLNKFIELFNSYYKNNNEFVFIDNNDEISLKFIEKFHFYKNKVLIDEIFYESDIKTRDSYYLNNFILFNKDLWKYEIKGNNEITKDIFFEKIFDTNYDNSTQKNEITLTLNKNIFIINKQKNITYNNEKYLCFFFNDNYKNVEIDKRITYYINLTNENLLTKNNNILKSGNKENIKKLLTDIYQFHKHDNIIKKYLSNDFINEKLEFYYSNNDLPNYFNKLIINNDYYDNTNKIPDLISFTELSSDKNGNEVVRKSKLSYFNDISELIIFTLKENYLKVFSIDLGKKDSKIRYILYEQYNIFKDREIKNILTNNEIEDIYNFENKILEQFNNILPSLLIKYTPDIIKSINKEEIKKIILFKGNINYYDKNYLEYSYFNKKPKPDYNYNDDTDYFRSLFNYNFITITKINNLLTINIVDDLFFEDTQSYNFIKNYFTISPFVWKCKITFFNNEVKNLDYLDLKIIPFKYYFILSLMSNFFENKKIINIEYIFKLELFSKNHNTSDKFDNIDNIDNLYIYDKKIKELIKKKKEEETNRKLIETNDKIFEDKIKIIDKFFNNEVIREDLFYLNINKIDKLIKLDKLIKDKNFKEDKQILDIKDFKDFKDFKISDFKDINDFQDFKNFIKDNINNMERLYYLIITNNNKYKIKFRDIIDYNNLYNTILNLDNLKTLINSKYKLGLNNPFINLIFIKNKIKNIDEYFTDTLKGLYGDIIKGGNKYNKYTLNELKEIAKKNKIKITKMVVISNDELHKKLKDKNIIINKKIKLEDFKRVLIENNIKITKRVNLTKQELIKKLINK
jgi:hypothetical protein